MTRVVVTRGDITTVAADVIVNAANAGLLGGGGVDGAIHRAGGPAILDACRAIIAGQGHCDPGAAVITTAGDLPAGHVIHTVGPIWTEERADHHDSTLSSCYVESLALAESHRARTVAFPNISTGVYGFPKARAASVATRAVGSYVAAGTALDEIIFVCFDDENEQLYRRLLA
ncbi:MAG: O-acetyl-ADP-ribose deacetylase [Acidimicrobiia bacterium]|nr:O-acetyl-ADP-ribose deacetylase [Acidimicrobiia bacterium]